MYETSYSAILFGKRDCLWILYRDESDIASIEITNYVKEHGIEKAIEVYCGLTENEWELKQLIMAQYKEAEKIR